MRRWRSSALGARCALVTVALAVMAGAAPLRAQGGYSTAGALVLLLPIGARSVGSGQTLSTSEMGAESLFGNPAGIARAVRAEVAMQYVKTIIVNGMAIGVVLPAGKAGVFGFAAELADPGAQDNTDPITGAVIGQLLPRDIVLSASYAATIGAHLRAGVSYKIVQRRLDCTGGCDNVPTFTASTNGIDAGIQYQFPRADSLSIGLATRNMGLKLQINDVSQSDPLPSLIHIGVRAFVPQIATALKGAELRWAGEIVSTTSFKAPGYRLGAELALQRQLYLRAGYASGTGDGPGPAIGLGFVRGRLGIDFARLFTGLSADVGSPPTFLTLRLSF